MISFDGSAKIGDFGEGRIFVDTETQSFTADRGSPEYRAPECWISRDTLNVLKCDVWSFGILLSRILRNQLIWEDGAAPLLDVNEEAWVQINLSTDVREKLVQYRNKAFERRTTSKCEGFSELICPGTRHIFPIVPKCLKILTEDRISFTEILLYLSKVSTENEAKQGKLDIQAILSNL